MRHLEGEDGCLLLSRPQTRNLLLIDNPYHVEPGVNVGVLALKCFPPEQFLCAEVRIRLHQWVDEVARIQILGFVWIDQDVGEWRSRVADISNLRQQCDDLTDHLVRCRDRSLQARRVDTGLIAFIVDDHERRLRKKSRRSGLQLLLERSEEHTSELQSLMRISYAVFCLKKK